MPNGLIRNNERAELTISFSPYYKLNITRDSMDYIFGWYLSGEYMGERNQYRWQKELIDMIEDEIKNTNLTALSSFYIFSKW